MPGRWRRRALGLIVAVVLVGAVFAVSTTSAAAYGKANWQVTANGTGTFPGTGFGLGFWGWCAFAGGVNSGNDGDCEFAQYIHAPAGSGFTCHVSLDVTSWDASGGSFVITGTASAKPASVAAPCLEFFPGSASYSGFDTGIPSAPGQYHFGTIFGGVGESNFTVTQVG